MSHRLWIINYENYLLSFKNYTFCAFPEFQVSVAYNMDHIREGILVPMSSKHIDSYNEKTLQIEIDSRVVLVGLYGL